MMGCNGIEHLCKEVLEEKKGVRQMEDDELVSVAVEVASQQDDDLASSNLEHQSLQVTSLSHRGLC